ncbi:hypothetical protein AXFE_14960 [Acidithrix ferrooxidans]|uniref:Uncharacterized protein n=1 Tax=Acidithrix ferrooxidans TaxID=1280514 RepID=A0A0D8HKG2_9ACTN|nr:hypothetical protein AXFE_14960 [Acidithrix ferrooxidans]
MEGGVKLGVMFVSFRIHPFIQHGINYEQSHAQIPNLGYTTFLSRE